MTKRTEVDGMTCDHCAATLRGALRAVPRVLEADVADVSFAEKRARVVAGEGATNEALIAAAATKGYRARPVPPVAIKAASVGERSAEAPGSFDLVIIGSGAAAFGAALRASELGATVAKLSCCAAFGVRRIT